MITKADIDAVAIVTSSGEHCRQITVALEAGKHVFCEKPLGVTIEECLQAEKVVENHPEQIFLLGFMRRFDASYRYGKQKIDAGEIGEPYLVKATGIDPLRFIEGALKFAPTSGGLFIDMAIHDIDLMRWYLNDDPAAVYAIGAVMDFRSSVNLEMRKPAAHCINLKMAEWGPFTAAELPRMVIISKPRLSERKVPFGSALCRRKTCHCYITNMVW